MKSCLTEKILMRKQPTEMLYLEPLEKIIRLSAQSAYVVNVEHPVSLLILANAEHGKTIALQRNVNALIKSKNIFYSNNVTAKYIEKNLLMKIKSGEIRHIVIPDLLNAIERGKSTRKLFVNFIKSLIEEGIFQVSDSFSEFQSDTPVKCGMITAITKANMKESWREWKNIGFVSRFIPFSYSYPMPKMMDLIDSVFFKKTKGVHVTNLMKDVVTHDIEIQDDKNLDYSNLKVLALTFGKQTEGIGIRMAKNLMSLVYANAMLEHRKKVTQKDINEIIRLSQWMNYDYRTI